MVKYYSGTQILKFSWDQLASAFWQRYPNPYSNHVLTEDVISREIVNQKLHTKRLLTKTNPVPKWGERFVSRARHVCIVEESIIDPVAKTVITYTRNIGLQRIMQLEEKCVYRTSADNTRWTVCERWAYINSSIFGFSRAIQVFALERYKKNVQKTQKGFEHILSRLYIMHDPSHSSSTDTISRVHGGKEGKQKLKETARKATELAQRPVLSTPGQIS
ncbi:PRELI domain-containing protein 1, mitochondrial [Octopus sinensis]|nr:PRELI domain-containing protein 1, mitochondrial [Octopus sinensis]